MGKKEINNKNFLDKLRIYVPEFKNIEKEEAVDVEDGVHYIMEVLKKFADYNIKRKNFNILRKIANFLDICWKFGEYEVHNAVMVSFFESLSQKNFDVIKTFLSKTLHKETEHYKKQWIEWKKTKKWKGGFFSKYDHYFGKKEKKEILNHLKKIRKKK